jgi:predicted RNA-binding Zn-ribbon protein involved in translation (DUF1610 family)
LGDGLTRAIYPEVFVIQGERNEHEIACPRCGANAECSFIDEGKSVVEILCPNCGEYEMSREEFDQTTTENAELTTPP